MSKNSAKGSADRGTVSPDVSIMVCQDCCCGTSRKHPNVDHKAQRKQLLALESETVRVQVVDCLDLCQQSNVVLVRDYSLPRRDRDTWLARMHRSAEIEAVGEWVNERAGGMPIELLRHVFTPDRKHRAP